MSQSNGNHDQFENLRLELRRGCLSLAVLSQLRTERYGYTLRKVLAEQGIEIDEGTLYPLLRRLESQGLLSTMNQPGPAGVFASTVYASATPPLLIHCLLPLIL